MTEVFTMINRSLKKEWELQDAAIAELPEGYEFPLFSARQAIESQRRSAYRTTAAAGQEIVDNAIEAAADRIHVIFDRVENTRGKKGEAVSKIAFIDNGAGMRPEMLRFALSWGGGTRFQHPDFLGRFGFGLPNASVNQTRLVRVYSRRRRQDPWMVGTLNVDAVDVSGKVNIPAPEAGDLPDFVAAYLKRTDVNLEHSTVVVWLNPDHLTYRTAANLKQHLVDHFGVVYRYLLEGLELVVEGVRVEPVDPLFLMPNARYYRAPEDGGAQKAWTRVLPVVLRDDPATGEKHLEKLDNEHQLPKADDPAVLGVGTITVTAAAFPLGFAWGAPSEGIPKPLDEQSKARWEIRKTRRGISFVRAGREIEIVDAFPRSARDTASGLGDWPLLQSYAYHWGVEVSFPPELDQAFGITNDKQAVRPIEDFWRLLAKEEFDEKLRWLNTEQRKARHETRQKAKQAKASDTPTAAERAMAAADMARGQRPQVPDHRKEESDQKKEGAARKRAEVTKEKLDEARKAIEQEARLRPYKIDYEEVANGPFYRPEWVNGVQVVVWINRLHPFYTTLYQSVLGLRDSGLAKDAIDAVLLCLARAELTTPNEQTQLFYQTQREDVWSSDIRRVMQALAAARTDEAEEEDGEYDVTSADSEAKNQTQAGTPSPVVPTDPSAP